MVPKFRGNDQDWLDDEGVGPKRSQSNRKKSAPEARSVGLPVEQSNAVVAEVFPNQCRVKVDQDQTDLLCNYRRAGVVSKSKEGIRERSPVAVGDRVLVNNTGTSTGIIEGLCARRNSLRRPAPGREGNKYFHVLAANIDYLVVVASIKEPEFSMGLVDRFLVAAETEGIPALLCITKLDLLTGEDQLSWKIYENLGYPLYEVSAKRAVGLDSLHNKIEGKTVVFCGHSGVGKTSLLRSLLKSDIGRVANVNEFTGKGRHTTTGAVLLGGPNQSRWIDTPGIREFGLAQVSPEQLSLSFPEFRKLDCSQAGCLHQDEPGCLARSLVRYPTYRRILDSLLAGEN